MNSVGLIGRLTRDPELRYTSGSQMAVARFSIAIDRPSRQGEERKTDFPRIVVFGKQAENCEKYLAKGRLVAVQGRIQTGSYQDKDGKTVYTTEVVADRVQFLEWGDRKEGGGNYGASGNYGAPQDSGNYGAPQGAASSSPASEEIEAEMPDSFQTINEDVPF